VQLTINADTSGNQVPEMPPQPLNLPQAYQQAVSGQAARPPTQVIVKKSGSSTSTATWIAIVVAIIAAVVAVMALQKAA
jgi:hypothetical protein